MKFDNDKVSSSSKRIESITLYTNHGFDPCAHVRIRGPLFHAGIKIIEGVIDGLINTEAVNKGDLVVIQRDFPKDIRSYEKIKELSKQYKKPIIYEIDDFLFDLPEHHIERKNEVYAESLLPMLQAIIESNIVIVPTEKLKDYYEIINKNIVVLPNFLDDNLWKLKPPTKKKENGKTVHIGYMGSETHQYDLEFILPVLENLIYKFPKIKFSFWGAKPPGELGKFSQVNWISSSTYQYINFSGFFQDQNVDIFIAPLEDNEFNRGKSHLKFLEYSCLGVPGVYSNLEPYAVVSNGVNGFLAKNEEEWIDCLATLIEDENLRYQMAENAQQTIIDKWLLSKNANLWVELFDKAINSSFPIKKEIPPLLPMIQSINYQYFSLISTKNLIIQDQTQKIISKNHELNQIKISKEWKLSLHLRRLFDLFIPENSIRRRIFKTVYDLTKGQRTKLLNKKLRLNNNSIIDTSSIFTKRNGIKKHIGTIDIIICVHNAIEDVIKCLTSIQKFTSDPYTIIIVDDGSDEETNKYLKLFSKNNQGVKLYRNKLAKGYTISANIGLRESSSSIKVLLNSDTIVGEEWIDRLYRAITSHKEVGIVGPLSNTASWQSIPELAKNGDWATNPLPLSISVEKMSQLISKYSGCIYPEVPLLNGFCLMIKKEVIDDIGYLDEVNFGQGYSEEDDFNIRAGKAGWKKIIADDVYVYHAQSKSFTHEMRFKLSAQNSEKLAKKHGSHTIANYVKQMNPNRIMEGVRHRSKILFEREEIISFGHENFKGKKLLFVLPVIDAGGGANIIIDESRAMRKMGVDVQIYNFKKFKSGFLQSYPNLDVPVIFGKEEELDLIGKKFDSVIASANYSVKALIPLNNYNEKPILGYYIQDYEPMMYPDGSKECELAKKSYSMIDNIKCFTKSIWNQETLFKETGLKPFVVGKSVNIDLYRPLKSIEYGLKPVTIVAMIRPSSPYRNPDFTLSILKKISKKYIKNVDIWLFGANDLRTSFSADLLDFRWRQLGKLNQNQVAVLLSHADIFTDFSVYQAMGLTSLEAMACGSSVIVPQKGGSREFIHHMKNGLVVDTSNFQDCYESLEELIKNDNLRVEFQITGSKDVVNYFPERAAYNILSTIFDN